MGHISHILLASDGSQCALKAASLAGDLARCCDAHISTVTVNNEDALLLPGVTEAILPGSAPFTPFPKRKVQDAVEKAVAEVWLPAIDEALGDLKQDVEHIQLWGHTVEQICDFARDHNVDLIVIGRRGRSAFRKALVGGVSSQVVNHAPCAVLIAH